MTQSNDLPARMSRTEDNMIDLKLAVSATLQAIDKNSADIEALREVSRRNSELRRHNSELGRRNCEQIAVHSEQTAVLRDSEAQTAEAIRDIRAAIERMDRLFDYLVRRDQGQLE